MGATIVDQMYADFEALLAILNEKGEPSLQTTMDDLFRKSLLLCAASYFEHRMTDAVLQFVEEKAHESILVVEFVRNKAISRQYYKWFKWERQNANNFFGLFGSHFLETMKREIKDDSDLDKGIRSFLELGHDRNRLVHQDYGSFSLEKTASEIYLKFKDAVYFIERFPQALRDHSISAGLPMERRAV